MLNISYHMYASIAFQQFIMSLISAEHDGQLGWLVLKIAILAMLFVWNLSCHVTKQMAAAWEPSTFSGKQRNILGLLNSAFFWRIGQFQKRLRGIYSGICKQKKLSKSVDIYRIMHKIKWGCLGAQLRTVYIGYRAATPFMWRQKYVFAFCGNLHQWRSLREGT